MCSIITYRSTRSSTKALIRSGIMGSASSPSALCLNVTHQGANSASSPLPLRMMRPAQLQAFSSQILVGQQLQRRLQEGVRGARRNSPCAICREPGCSGHSWQSRDWHQQPERPQKDPKGPQSTAGSKAGTGPQPCPGHAQPHCPAPFGRFADSLLHAELSRLLTSPICLPSGRNAIQKEVIKSRR